jgi:hypothetical protein
VLKGELVVDAVLMTGIHSILQDDQGDAVKVRGAAAGYCWVLVPLVHLAGHTKVTLVCTQSGSQSWDSPVLQSR